MLKAINIMWDVDDKKDLKHLPTEIFIPEGMTDKEEINDYLSDKSGFCHYGFELINMENKYYKGFNRDGFIEWLEDKHGLNSFAVELLDNIIDYAHKHERVSKDQFIYFVSDLVPEIEFIDVANFCEDAILTNDTLRLLGRIE